MQECRACDSFDSEVAFRAPHVHGRHVFDKAKKFVFSRCRECGCINLTGVSPEDSFYAKYYDKDYYGSANTAPSALSLLLTDWSNARKVKRITKLFRNHEGKLRLLDVGCGRGEFLSSLPSDRFYAEGIEMNGQAAQVCKLKGLQVSESRFPESEKKDSVYDVITMWHSLEHFSDPLGALKEATRILKPNGRLLVSTPNVFSLGCFLGRWRWFHLDAPRHFFLPTPAAMRNIAERAGLRISSVRNDWLDFPLDLFWSARRSFFLPIVVLFYPILKFLSGDSITIVMRHNGETK